jgi:hypothetical protein
MSFATILAVVVVSIVLMPIVSNSYSGVEDANAMTESVVTSGSNGTLLVEGSNGTLLVEGTDGADGADGADGTDGTRGANGVNGAGGLRGADGADGADGKVILGELTIPELD